MRHNKKFNHLGRSLLHLIVASECLANKMRHNVSHLIVALCSLTWLFR